MTKNTKKLLGLVGALAVLGGAYGTIVLINQHNEEKKAEQSKAEKEANTFYLSQMEEPVSISYTKTATEHSHSAMTLRTRLGAMTATSTFQSRKAI